MSCRSHVFQSFYWCLKLFLNFKYTIINIIILSNEILGNGRVLIAADLISLRISTGAYNCIKKCNY
jgi:hypothetical protein